MPRRQQRSTILKPCVRLVSVRPSSTVKLSQVNTTTPSQVAQWFMGLSHTGQHVLSVLITLLLLHTHTHTHTVFKTWRVCTQYKKKKVGSTVRDVEMRLIKHRTVNLFINNNYCYCYTWCTCVCVCRHIKYLCFLLFVLNYTSTLWRNEQITPNNISLKH